MVEPILPSVAVIVPVIVALLAFNTPALVTLNSGDTPAVPRDIPSVPIYTPAFVESVKVILPLYILAFVPSVPIIHLLVAFDPI